MSPEEAAAMLGISRADQREIQEILGLRKPKAVTKDRPAPRKSASTQVSRKPSRRGS
jgi:hypothetical protein